MGVIFYCQSTAKYCFLAGLRGHQWTIVVANLQGNCTEAPSTVTGPTTPLGWCRLDVARLGRLFFVNSQAELWLQYLVLINSIATNNVEESKLGGGTITADLNSVLRMASVVVANSSSENHGGAIAAYEDGTVSLSNVTLSSNKGLYGALSLLCYIPYECLSICQTLRQCRFAMYVMLSCTVNDL